MQERAQRETGVRSGRNYVATSTKAKGILTDTHFLIPVVVFCFGLALLIVLH